MSASHLFAEQPTRLRRVGKQRRRQQKQRRGILILIVLSLLFMFVMIAVTFVLVANRQNSTATKAAAADVIGDTPRQEIEQAFNEIVRGSSSPLSPFNVGNNLLGDIFGDPPSGGAGANPNQYVRCVSGSYNGNSGNGYATVTLARTTNEYDGRVITVIPGANTGTKSSLVSSRIMASDGTNVYLLPFRDPTGAALTNGTYDFLINGREFAGTGKATGPLIVNPVSSMASGTDPSAPGGENESYDAPDFNNIFLAYYDPLSGRIKPSFHDPALISSNTMMPKENQQNSFRVIKTNAFDSYQWDVDNDGDGIMDSIWIDPGFPIQVSRDGRLYKRLIAPLILDLDGRLNINTAGTTKEIASLTQAPTNMIPFATGGGAGAIQLGRGHGFGPAEISIKKTPLGGIATNLLQGKGRYHSDSYPGPDTAGLFQNKILGTPNDYQGSALMATRYTGSPPDHWGRYMRGIDISGNTLFANYWQEGAGGETTYSPYLLDMTRDQGRGLDTTTTAKDNQFSAGELERFLRGFDSDALNLPNRLYNMVPGSAEQQFIFRGVTTDSWDTPVLGVLPQASAGGNPTKHFSELLPQNLRTDPKVLRTLIPQDMLAGLRFNINWPFGDGKDNNNNGVVDEIGENETTVNPTPTVNQGIDTNLDGTTNATDNYFARQQMAKYLYVLMTLIQDPGLNHKPTEQVQQRLAQWAVNVVDYMDADNVMTCFEYDVNIADGWIADANGILTANDLTAGGDLRVVWGVEQPALLLTEAFAPHDRRVRDSKNDNNATKGTKRDDDGMDDDMKKGKDHDDDDDLDQSLIPRGPTFFELYATHSPLQPVGSADLYDYDKNAMKWRLKLDKVTPDRTPVWRVVVTASKTAPTTPEGNDFQTLANTYGQTFTGQTPQFNSSPGYNQNVLFNGGANIPQATIDRVVVFAKQSDVNASPLKEKNLIYCLSEQNPTPSDPNELVQQTPQNLALFGGQYAVIFPHVTENTAYSMGHAKGGGLNYQLGNEADAMGTKKGIPGKQAIRINYNQGNGFNGGTSGKSALVFNDTTGSPHSSYGSIDYALPVTIPIASLSNAVPIALTAEGEAPTPAPTGSWGRVGFSVTEPLYSKDYYPLPEVDNPESGLKESYGDPNDDAAAMSGKCIDKPFESSKGSMPDAPIVKDGMISTNTYSNYKTLVLQRVADPTRNYDEVNNPYITVDWLPIDVTVFNGDDKKPATASNFADQWDIDDNGTLGQPMGPRQRGDLITHKPGAAVPGNFTDNSNYHLWSPVSKQLPTANPGAKNAMAIFAYEIDRGSGTPAQTLGYLNASYGDPAPLSATPPRSLYNGAPQRPFPNLSWNNRPFMNPYEVMLVPASQAGRLGLEYGAPLITGENYVVNAAPTGTFGHLLNFFTSSQDPTKPANYHLILDWLTTGSPFKGTETWLDATKASNIPATQQGINKFKYPFNYVHSYREPGKPNINTISDPRVWDAVMGDWNTAGYGCTFQELVYSRRASTTNPHQLDANGSLPSYWGNPFRVASAAGLVPSSMNQPTNNVGLLRQHPSKPNIPLFGVNDYTSNQAAGNEYRDASRHRLMAVENIERLSNLVTTRSNVYAIWVTVGYFEVTPGGSTPDGYTIGQELGTDTGEIKRHRGFGIYDRSIPVGYERGMNHNVEKGFLIKKMLD